jgi:hypothetical protein
MSVLDSIEARWIKRELSTPIYAKEINASSKFMETVAELAAKIYQHDMRGRSIEQIKDQCIVGKYGELAIYTRLKNAGMRVEWNDEALSGEYHWDIKVEGLSIELKYQSRYAAPDRFGKLQKRAYFSFDDAKKVETAIMKWRSHHLVIGWYGTKLKDVLVDVHPWVLLDSQALDPEQGLFVLSNYSGYYLQMVKASGRGMLKYLNPI